MTIALLFPLLLLSSSVLAIEPPAAQHGFLVFSEQGVASYAQDAEGRLRLQGKSKSGRIDEFATAGGHIYRMNKQAGAVLELGADLKPLHAGSVKSETDVPHWLGAWDEGMLVLNDNAVLYLDAKLQETARLPLKPQQHDHITPVLAPVDFDAWEHRGYLLANSGELFVIPLDRPKSATALSAALQVGEGVAPDAQWIDPSTRTLNFIAKTQAEEHDTKLKPGETRVIKQQLVLTYPLKKLRAPALRSVIHEEREIHEPINLDLGNENGEDGRIYERRPPYRSEGPAKGAYIGIVSRTTPAYAEAFEEKTSQPLAQLAIVRLKSRGQYEVMALSQDAEDSPLWFREEAGRRYIESDMGEHELRLQPEPYGELIALPELRGGHFKVLAY